MAGAGVQWLRDEMELVKDAAQTEAFANAVEDTNGVYVVPAFTGLGAPYWNPYARGTVVGLTRGCKKGAFCACYPRSDGISDLRYFENYGAGIRRRYCQS